MLGSRDPPIFREGLETPDYLLLWGKKKWVGLKCCKNFSWQFNCTGCLPLIHLPPLDLWTRKGLEEHCKLLGSGKESSIWASASSGVC